MPETIQKPHEFTPFIHLVYSTAEIPLPTPDRIREGLAAVDDRWDPSGIHLDFEQPDGLQVSGLAGFGDHHVQVSGLPAPLPSTVIDRTVHVSRWQPQFKAAIRQHRSTLSLVYLGDHPDPVEKMIALYGLARSFQDENLLGLINEQAWTAHPPASYLAPAAITAFRQTFPFDVWVGYIRFFIDDDHFWLATKGHHIFDVPDLAYLMSPAEDEGAIIQTMANIFYYIYEDDGTVTAGDTLEIGEKGPRPTGGRPTDEHPTGERPTSERPTGRLWRFGPVTEEEAPLIGPSGTLVIEKSG